MPFVAMAVPRSREGIPGNQTKDGTTQTFNNFYATQNRKVQTVQKTAFTKTKATQTPNPIAKVISVGGQNTKPAGDQTDSELKNRLKQLDQGNGRGGSTGNDASAASA